MFGHRLVRSKGGDVGLHLEQIVDLCEEIQKDFRHSVLVVSFSIKNQ